MADAAISVEGLTEFRKELRELGKMFPRELTKIHKEIATVVADKARSNATAMGGQQRHAASKIAGRATQAQSRITVNTGGKVGRMANAAFWGANKKTGWYNRRRYRSDTKPQFKAWVGQSWTVGASSGGPYALNAAVNQKLPEIAQLYNTGFDALVAKAFPVGSKPAPWEIK